ncbi:MAG: class II fructose-bisphosphate aldolase [Planctomycetes bacterium]|nr:class II fructose-bisphosphate aldolase [Planctomycetota bacterium]
MTMVDTLRAKRAAGQAVLAANFYNAETLLAVLRAAKSVGEPIILQTSPSTLQYTGLPMAVAMARAAAAQEGVTALLHLDHCNDLALIRACLDAGYDSVMIDASEQQFDANVAAVRAVVALAHAKGVAVEAELGTVPKLGEAAATVDGLTVPEDARRFVEATGIDSLAVAIGTAHGFYKQEPKLDLNRLEAIRAVVDVPLVLHGGSGVSPGQWRDAIRRGIAKINFATEIKDTFTRAVKQTMSTSEEIDLRKTFPPAMAAVTALVSEKIRVCAMKTAAAS